MDIFVEYKEYVFGVLAVLYVLLSIAGQRAAYQNGIRDTFYYVKEPDHPGARRVKKFVEDNMHEHL